MTARLTARSGSSTGTRLRGGDLLRRSALVVGVLAVSVVAACVPEEPPAPNPDVTVGAPSPTVVYGDGISVLHPTYTGNITPATPATCAADVSPASPPGTYPVTCAGAADPGRTFIYENGYVTVVPAPLTVLSTSTSMTYGGTVPTIVAGYLGLKNGQTSPAGAPTCSTTATSSSPVGNYPTSCIGAVDPNYAITYVGGSVYVGRAVVGVTASSTTTTYGEVAIVSASYDGFLFGEAGPATPAACASATTATTGVGLYATTCDGAVDPNYDFAYVPGFVTIVPAAAFVIASSASVGLGEAVPTITASYSGLVNGEIAPTVAPTCSTTATSASPTGVYPSTCTGAADTNYTLDYVDGTVTITA